MSVMNIQPQLQNQQQAKKFRPLVVNPIVQLYGADSLKLSMVYIHEVRSKSNFQFTEQLMRYGTSFMQLKALEMLENRRTDAQRYVSLKSLVTESFGDAAVAVYQC